MRKITPRSFLTLATCALFFNVLSYAQNCNTELSILKDRDARSITVNDPTEFRLVLTNNSSKSQNYQIQARDITNTCNRDGKNIIDSRSNHNLNVAILQNRSNNSSINVPANSSKEFSVKVSAPSNVRYDAWSCIQLVANSAFCGESVTKTIKVFVSDPSDD